MWKITFIFLLLSQWAHAYKFTRDFQNGFYWQYLPIDISVVEKDPALRETLEELTALAIKEWEESANLEIWNFTPGSKTTNIIRWSNNFAKETSMASGVLAVAIRYTDGPYFARTEIVINGNYFGTRFNNSDLFTTIKHELGHTMGLDHSDVQSSIMWPSLQVYGAGIGQDDIEGLNAAYDTMLERQLTRYVSPLAYAESKEVGGLSCATVSSTPMMAGQGLLSLFLGILISFVRKVKAKFKSFF